jgi:hypothetical protein
VQVVLLRPGREVVGLDPDHDVLHGGDPLLRAGGISLSVTLLCDYANRFR